mmetsp:Transcript_8068/g.23039  ORF Transcript_8068/g.23039 Transcript_8068/m.23039 type:complete len:307 (-) Transcript_8068:1579-2499(-)
MLLCRLCDSRRCADLVHSRWSWPFCGGGALAFGGVLMASTSPGAAAPAAPGDVPLLLPDCRVVFSGLGFFAAPALGGSPPAATGAGRGRCSGVGEGVFVLWTLKVMPGPGLALWCSCAPLLFWRTRRPRKLSRILPRLDIGGLMPRFLCPSGLRFGLLLRARSRCASPVLARFGETGSSTCRRCIRPSRGGSSPSNSACSSVSCSAKERCASHCGCGSMRVLKSSMLSHIPSKGRWCRKERQCSKVESFRSSPSLRLSAQRMTRKMSPHCSLGAPSYTKSASQTWPTPAPGSSALSVRSVTNQLVE